MDYWRNRLLDLGKRNRLINCPAPKQGGRVSRSSISINVPDANTLWRQFANGNNPLVFPFSNESETPDELDEDSSIPIKSITNQSLSETQKTLRNLLLKAKTFNEEKGLNALHLAFGFLNWHENGGDKGAELRSPLLLVPVQLAQENLFAPFTLSRHDDEIVANYALSQKLQNDFGIVIPDYSDGMSLAEYINKVEIKCKTMSCTITLEVDLSLFSFLKINMYQDLSENANEIMEHPLIKIIAGDSSPIGQDVSINVSEFDHDAIEPQEVFCVVDADSSQQDAIQLAKRGASFILQGPPGTGKSQTITNIIAELLSDGKSVLFVSEKMAALEVVQKRLKATGLNHFCLSLHSHNAKRREVLDQLEVSLKLAQNRASLTTAAFDRLAQLKTIRTLLNDYSRELHTSIEPLEKTIFNANGTIAKLNDVPDVLFAPTSPDSYTKTDLAARLNFLNDFAHIVSESGYQTNNPWQGCTLENVTNQFRQQFLVDTKNTFKTVIALVTALKKHDESLSANKLTYEDFVKCADCINSKLRLDAERESIANLYREDVFKINGEELWQRCQADYGNFLRIFKTEYKADCKMIGGCKKTAKKTSFKEMKAVAQQLKHAQEFDEETKRLFSLVKPELKKAVANIADSYERLAASLNWFVNLFEQPQRLYSKPLDELCKQIKACAENFSSLEQYVDYRAAISKSVEMGIDGFVQQAAKLKLKSDLIVPAFEKCFYRAWLDAVLPKYKTVQAFRRLKQDDCITRFRELDKSHMEISKAALISKLISRLPSLDAFTSGHDELGLLKKELAKQRKLMPTRKLIASLSNLLPVLKPCMMMSPLSVSTYLRGGNYKFDAVIFDEASQVRTEDAIGALFRSKQAIIAGDSKQLPPTEFFAVSISAPDDNENDEEEFSDIGAYESLLDEASLLPTKKLLWHYRSRHEHLIAFSNTKIYGGDLVTFPSSVENAPDVGVQYVHVANGTYDRGGRNGNRAEAEEVAELVFEHFNKYPQRSLGIIAFGEAQQSAIIDALLKKRRENPEFEQFFRDDSDESVFIKNLETVQGDERDSIIFSIGYAPDITGKFIMNFGPLNRQGGERRLNVAVTRARFNVKLVGSILPTDIDIERTSSEGPKLLRLYIDFALNGINAILGEVSESKELTFDSPFETAVYNYLVANGYDVATQVGCSGYRIDMAARHPKYKGRFALGIECDGASYHSARTARERDRLRQAVLENMGWSIYRIWSTDWIKDPINEGRRLSNAIDEAINNYRETVTPEAAKAAPLSDYLYLGKRPETNTELPRPAYYGYAAKDVPLSDFQNTMLQIVTQSYGIDKEGLFKATALCYGWQRRGDVIKNRMKLAYRRLMQSGLVNEVDGKVEKK
jgi:very-short-patch-repair endonuclease/DNA polymerase III delta prime subunit